jgi:eukaryotic-like serine/threonine-protein kinase
VTGELEPGLLVDGRYQLLFRLGKGGMGEVWAAAHSQSALGFSKTVALKVLRTEEMTSNSAKMFFDEANAASALQHAAIVSTTDLGRDGDILFIAMELVRGPSLTAVLQRLVINKRAMSPALVGHLGVQIASALDFAQARASHQGQLLKLVHRDISPHNVLVDLNGSVKLTDFGVARTTIQSHESHVGTVRGKPSYMAPEQVVGGDIDARTDLFALGIVLYESACLKRLFGRSNPVKSMDAVLKHEPKSLLELMPDFPPKLWAVIDKALKKDPNQRYQSAHEMLDALNDACRGLEGYSSAPRDFVALIDKNFDPGAFDIDGRVQVAMSEVDAVPPAQAVGLPRPTSSSPSVRPAVSMFAPELGGTKAAWPSAYAADPLAPEAIEEARTQFRAITPSQTPVMPISHSQEAMRALTQSSSQSGSHASLTGLSVAAQPRRKGLAPALMLGAAAVVLLGAAALVVAKGNKAEPTTQSAQRAAEPEPPTAIDVTPRNTPSVTAQPNRVVEKKDPPEEIATTQQQPTRNNATRNNATRTPSAPQTTNVAKAEPEAPAPTMTWSSVWGTVKEAESKDPARAKELKATMTELGSKAPDSPERNKALAQVLRDAKQIIAEAK